jgi:hypothetical protein
MDCCPLGNHWNFVAPTCRIAQNGPFEQQCTPFYISNRSKQRKNPDALTPENQAFTTSVLPRIAHKRYNVQLRLVIQKPLVWRLFHFAILGGERNGRHVMTALSHNCRSRGPVSAHALGHHECMGSSSRLVRMW